MKKSVNFYVERTGLVFSIIGTILIFVGVWSNGFTILRLVITGLLLILWGNGILLKLNKEEKDKGEKNGLF